MKPFLFLENASKSYPTSSGEFFALKNATLSFSSQGLVAVKGKSGSGKSTLLQLLSSIDRPQKGELYFQGKPVFSSPSSVWRFRKEEIGFLFQHYNLLSGLSVLENIMIPLHIVGVGKAQAKKRAKELLRFLNMEKLGKRKAESLSGGEKQRVALCRAIIKEPSILFADEPTGALDESNSRAVMELLRRYAKDHLVIFVSHNEELICSYAQRIIEIQDGKIVKDSEADPLPSPYPVPFESKYGKGWTKGLLRKNLRRNGIFNLLCLFSGGIGYASLLCCVGFLYGSPLALAEEKTHSLQYGYGTISRQELVEIPSSPLSLVKSFRPDLAEVNSLFIEGELEVTNDYSFFFPLANGYRLDGEEQDPVSFSPIYSFSSPLVRQNQLLRGFFPEEDNLRYCLVNDCFLLENENALDKTITVYLDQTLERSGATDSLLVPIEMRIAGVVKEFSFMNSPRVYYSFLGLQALLQDCSLPEISFAEKEERNVVSFLESSSSDSCYSGYAYSLFAKTKKGAEHLAEVMDELEKQGGGLSISSSALYVASSFESLSEALSITLLLFVGIAMVSLAMVVGMSSFASYLSAKKDAALLLLNGAKAADIESVYGKEKVLICLASTYLGFAISPFLQTLFNSLLYEKFAISGLILIPFFETFFLPCGLLFGCVILSILLSYLSSVLPLHFGGKIHLASEIKDE